MNNNKVIFTLLDSPAMGGAEQYLFSHLIYLNRNGFHILLATNNKKVKIEINLRIKKYNLKNFSVINLPYVLDAIGNWRGLIKYFLALPNSLYWSFKILKKLKNDYRDVICLWSGFSDRLSFSPIAKFLKCKIIWIEIGPLEPTFKKNFGFPKFIYKLTEKFVDHLVTTSLFTKKSILKNTNFKNKNITLIYPGCKIISPKEINKYKIKAKSWIKKEKLEKFKLIGTMARIARENEIDLVINAFKKYKQNYKDKNTKLIIIGDGPERAEMENLSKSLGIYKDIIFTGFVSEEEKLIYLSILNAFIFPRAWELDGFGMTTIEAMALGIPVLTSNFGPQIEIITEGIEGYKYKPHDVNDLSKNINKILKLNNNEKIKMSKNALKRANDFSEIKSQKLMLSLINNLIF